MNDLKIAAQIGAALSLFVQMSGKTMTDEQALSVSSMHEKWRAGRVFKADDVSVIVRHNDNLYRIVSAHTAQAHYPPDAVGVLALYRPIVQGHTGTSDDPIPYVYGMDVTAGLHYSYNGEVWTASRNMAPCVWPPAEGNEWVREEAQRP